MASLCRRSKKPMVVVIMTDKRVWADTLDIFKNADIPVYDLPEVGARALVALTRYGRYRARNPEN
jgi:acyl-CoA synthetase (NDP forming)